MDGAQAQPVRIDPNTGKHAAHTRSAGIGASIARKPIRIQGQGAHQRVRMARGFINGHGPAQTDHASPRDESAAGTTLGSTSTEERSSSA
jgi:hypothetical protein